jgi:putative inorganic carbon (hco3(-)) transporter
MTGFAPVAVIREAKARVESLPVPSIIFIVYCFFLIDYFGRLSARIPAYGNLRPTIILVAIISLLLLTQLPKVRHALTEKPIQIILLLIFYIFISLPLVEWPGSVVKNNLDDFIKAVVFLFFTAIIIDTDRRLKIFVTLFLGLQLVRILEPLTTYFLTGELGEGTHIGSGEFAPRLTGAPADVIGCQRTRIRDCDITRIHALSDGRQPQPRASMAILRTCTSPALCPDSYRFPRCVHCVPGACIFRLPG